MTKEQAMVSEFMRVFRQAMLSRPALPNKDVLRLRAELILEEALETINALGFVIYTRSIGGKFKQVSKQDLISHEQPDLVEIIDGLADLHYVGYCGTGLALGVDMEKVFEEVHRSNMTKAWKQEEIEQARKLYPDGIVEDYGGGLFRVLVDGKVMKSPSYSKARIGEIITQQQK